MTVEFWIKPTDDTFYIGDKKILYTMKDTVETLNQIREEKNLTDFAFMKGNNNRKATRGVIITVASKLTLRELPPTMGDNKQRREQRLAQANLITAPLLTMSSQDANLAGVQGNKEEANTIIIRLITQ